MSGTPRTSNIALLYAALEQRCPKCHQEPMQPCVDRFGLPMDVPHSMRYGTIPGMG